MTKLLDYINGHMDGWGKHFNAVATIILYAT